MDMKTALVDHFDRILSQQQFNFVNLSTVGNHLQGLSKRQKAYLKKTGYKRFFVDHPNNFAVIDDIVVLVHNDQPPVEITPSRNRITTKPPSTSPSFKPPSKSTIESIKEDIRQSNLCVICSDDMKVYAFGSCFHPICYKCCTKLRVLCNDKHCPVCRAELSQALFISELKTIEELDLSTFIIEQKYGVYFESTQIQTMYRKLLEHHCPKSNCATKFDDFDELKRHMQRKHGEYFCEICVKQCKMFTHDRKTYSSLELKEHEEAGDEGVGSAHKGHPLCKFCDCRYLDKDELLRHLQQHHCTCHLCENSSYVFYADGTDLWSHFSNDHFVCNEPECIGMKSNAFGEESELQLHKSIYHISKKPKSNRRTEQPVILNITHGNNGDVRGLTFTSPSRSIDVSSAHSSPVSFQTDGSIRCYGKVISLTSFYGFIQRDGNTSSFEDNIFFSQEAYGLDINDDLRLHVNIGDRVRVHALPNNNHRSKWRAVDVTVADSSPLGDLDGYSTDRTRTTSGCSELMLNGIAESDLPNMAEDTFPALPSGSRPGIDRTPTPSGLNWNKVIGTKQPVKKTRAVPAATTSTTSSTSKAANSSSDGLSGVGVVHHNLQPAFGFITKPGAAFEDNIYFNLLSYKIGMNSPNASDLTKELKIGDKIAYELEDPDKVKRQTKSKYRATKVWKPTANESVVEKLPSLKPSQIAKISSPSKPPQTTTPKKITAESKDSSKSRKKKHKISELSSDVSNDTPLTNGHLMPSSSHAELDTFGSPPSPPSQYFSTYALPQVAIPVYDEESKFLEVLAKILKSDDDVDGDGDLILEFETDLEIQCLPPTHVAHVHFAVDQHPIVHSILKPDSPQGDSMFHTSFEFDSMVGFNKDAVDILCASGVAKKSSDNFYYINKSGMYITLRRDSKGNVKELDLHTSFRFE